MASRSVQIDKNVLDRLQVELSKMYGRDMYGKTTAAVNEAVTIYTSELRKSPLRSGE